MEKPMTCPVCGTFFLADRSTQRYCSAACRKKDYRKHSRHDGAPPESAPVLRSFQCRKCGKTVAVTDPRDMRSKFCSAHCEKLYWKHKKKTEPESESYTFRCKQCGALVTVTEARDRRTAFCSEECRKRWHSAQQKEIYRKKEENMRKDENNEKNEA